MTGESLSSRISSAVLYYRAGLPALNVWLSRRAEGIWGSVAQRFPELLEALGDDDQVAREHTWFPLSRRRLGREPTPMYV